MVESNGTISSMYLGIESHGILTFMIQIDGDGDSQGYGGYSCGHGDFLATAIRALLDAFEIKEWEGLKGKNVRVRRDSSYGKIIGIGHIVKDKWVDLDKLSKNRDG